MTTRSLLPLSLISVLGLACSFAGCSHNIAPNLGPPEGKVLTQEQAILVIEETLARKGTGSEPKWPLRIDNRSELVVDVRVGQKPLAIEWVSAEDRTAHGGVLPQRDPDGPLHIITAQSDEARTAQVLVLDASAYGYEGNPSLVQRGAPSIGDAEARVRKDVEDFLDYASDQEAL
jgi:hypothetical protein